MKELIIKTIKKIGGEPYYRYLYEKFSYFINRKQYDKEKNDQHIRKLFYGSFIKRNDLVFDIGANEGNRVLPLMRLGAIVIAVEPQPDCCRLLKYKFGNKIVVVQKGVSSKVEQRKMFIAEHSVYSSFSEDWVKEIAPLRGVNPYKREEVIEMTTLEDLFAKFGKPVFIKIDVEGFELEVLKGLKSQVRMISLEYTVPELLEGNIECLELLYNIDQRIQLNYSVGEGMEWALNKWLPFHDFVLHMKSDLFLKTGFGDIYIKNEAIE